MRKLEFNHSGISSIVSCVSLFVSICLMIENTRVLLHVYGKESGRVFEMF